MTRAGGLPDGRAEFSRADNEIAALNMGFGVEAKVGEHLIADRFVDGHSDSLHLRRTQWASYDRRRGRGHCGGRCGDPKRTQPLLQRAGVQLNGQLRGGTVHGVDAAYHRSGARAARHPQSRTTVGVDQRHDAAL